MQVDSIIIDVQGFRLGKNVFIPKEVASYDSNGSISHFLLKCPFDYSRLSKRERRTNDWLTKFHHSLKWSDGFVSMEDYEKILMRLTRNVPIVYVKGKEKALHIGKTIKRCVLEVDEKETNIKKSSPHCTFHISNDCVCALSNVYKLSTILPV